MNKPLLLYCLVATTVLLRGDAGRVPFSPQVIGHRGLEHHAPENTATNFKAALQLRVGIEVDVRRAKDGTWVCMHDATLDRTTNARGPVGTLTFGQLRLLDAGSYLSPFYRGEPVPAFEELLVLLRECRDPHLLVAVDLKETNLSAEAELVELARRHGVLEQLIFIGLTIVDRDVRARLRAADARTQIAVLAQTRDDVPAALADPHATWAYLRFVPDADTVQAIHAAGRRVFVVGKSVEGLEVANWRRAKAAGVDAIMTEYPLECRRSLHFTNP